MVLDVNWMRPRKLLFLFFWTEIGVKNSLVLSRKPSNFPPPFKIFLHTCKTKKNWTFLTSFPPFFSKFSVTPDTGRKEVPGLQFFFSNCSFLPLFFRETPFVIGRLPFLWKEEEEEKKVHHEAMIFFLSCHSHCCYLSAPPSPSYYQWETSVGHDHSGRGKGKQVLCWVFMQKLPYFCICNHANAYIPSRLSGDHIHGAVK